MASEGEIDYDPGQLSSDLLVLGAQLFRRQRGMLIKLRGLIKLIRLNLGVSSFAISSTQAPKYIQKEITHCC
jgi:hypothetical protein